MLTPSLGNGFRYSGLKYYGVCFCGDMINGPPADESQCKLPCSGDKSQTCGGNQVLSVWEDKTFPKKAREVSVDDYKPIGCFSDDSSKGRTLTWPASVNSASLTPAVCIEACKADGFPYAGTEYGGKAIYINVGPCWPRH
jgi:hypothetical protein